MHSPRKGINGGPPPELSNNPFIDHPTNALSRYPDINGIDQPSGTNQFTSWMQPSSPVASTPTGQFGFRQSSSYGSSFQAPQQTGFQGSGLSQQGGYGAGHGAPVQNQSTGRPFQPSTAFGQELSGQLNSAGYGLQIAPQQQQQQPQYTGYSTSPQYGQSYSYTQAQPQYTGVPQQNTQYFPEFDPYSQQAQAQVQAPSASSGGSQYRPPHPREFVQQNKQELEAWDTYAWKQAFNSFDALKEAWATRKKEIEARASAHGGQGLFAGGGGYGYGNYGQAQELGRLEQLSKEAASNIDIAAAASFQMQEVHSGYRQSGDLASKRRVRESINAALQSLPDWPPQSW